MMIKFRFPICVNCQHEIQSFRNKHLKEYFWKHSNSRHGRCGCIYTREIELKQPCGCRFASL